MFMNAAKSIQVFLYCAPSQTYTNEIDVFLMYLVPSLLLKFLHLHDCNLSSNHLLTYLQTKTKLCLYIHTLNLPHR